MGKKFYLCKERSIVMEDMVCSSIFIFTSLLAMMFQVDFLVYE